ncbi:MAG: hypothetical protein ACLTWE_10640 [Dysgonomonas mossii]|uniref:hypothetical protein n=1 Tax=Dysgonomonas mossii TaxID=163665 RepID=UPI0039950C13
MNSNITVRIYFEHGKKVKGLTFRQKLFHGGFSYYMLKETKQAEIKQVICFNISAGYLSTHKNIQWGHSEVTPIRHPQCIELTDSDEKIYGFLKEYEEQLKNTEILIVKNEVNLFIYS